MDPGTDQILILAHEDHKGEPFGADIPKSPEDHYVLQRVEPDGTIGARYVDTSNFFKKRLEVSPEAPNSPIVVPGAPEHIYVSYDGITQIPYGFEGEPSSLFTEEGEERTQEAGESEAGGGLSLSPEGVIVGLAGIKNEIGAEIGNFPGVFLRSASDGSELGWAGGQTPELGGEFECVLEPVAEELPTLVAAGSGGKVFALAAVFLDEELEQFSEFSKVGSVVEFGPGGSGCPTASASPPVAEVKGRVLTGGEAVQAGVPVTFSSRVQHADAVSVEWDFGDGTTETVSAEEFKTPKVTHSFAAGGRRVVTETIHTDDLANGLASVEPFSIVGETLVQTTSVTVESLPPFALFTGPERVTVGEPAVFTGERSDPNGPSARPLKYHWTFGDGAEATTESSAAVSPVSHRYQTAGVYEVALVVTDRIGQTSSKATQPIDVTTPPPAVGGGGAGAGGGASPPPPARAAAQPGPSPQPPAIPNARLASTVLAVSSSGAVPVRVSCPPGESRCMGTVILRALGAGKGKAIVLTLAAGSFTLAGGQVKTVTLHLSAKGRKLLARAHVVRALATIVARDLSGATHTTRLTVILRPAKPKHKTH